MLWTRYQRFVDLLKTTESCADILADTCLIMSDVAVTYRLVETTWKSRTARQLIQCVRFHNKRPASPF